MATDIELVSVDRLAAQASRLRRAITKADDAPTLVKLCIAIDTTESLMRKAGFYHPEKIRPANEARFEARWKLGRLLAKIERAPAGRRAKNMSQSGTHFRSYLKEINLDKNRAEEAQRIGSIPSEAKLRKAFEEAEREGEFVTISMMLDFARPWWKLKVRERKHRAIMDAAQATNGVEIGETNKFGPFPLIYADPPWRFETFAPTGGGRSPDQHYPTLTDDEIVNFAIGDKRMSDVAHEDAALFLWCTSSNLPLALRVMEGWGFTFKTSAVWVKEIPGMGLVFRNYHEVLLYGSRGEMPGPVYVPPSVFKFPRGRHSEKPSEIRIEIEKMYPDFDATSRLEIFARGNIQGWTTYGLESNLSAA